MKIMLENCSQAVDEFQAGVKKGEINDQQMAKIIKRAASITVLSEMIYISCLQLFIGCEYVYKS